MLPQSVDSEPVLDQSIHQCAERVSELSWADDSMVLPVVAFDVPVGVRICYLSVSVCVFQKVSLAVPFFVEYGVRERVRAVQAVTPTISKNPCDLLEYFSDLRDKVY